MHLLFKNGVYHTSGSQEIAGRTEDGLRGDGARRAGYRDGYTVTTLEDFKKRLPGAS